MNKLILCAVCFAFSLMSYSVYAQTTALAAIASSAPAGVISERSKTTNEPLQQARRQLIASFNMFRDYSISVDTLEVNTQSKEIAAIGTRNAEQDFSAYLDKMEKILQRKMERLEQTKAANTRYATDRTQLVRGQTLLKSARCLAENTLDIPFSTAKDLDGNEVTAFALDALKSNSRYGMVEAYKDGFARIKKDQVFGFLNYCGTEVITCQYEQAEPFNNGRALVKKMDWFFVEPDGSESEPLANVVKAQALKNGISLVTFGDGRQALVDNTYDQSKKPISAFFDAIEPFFERQMYRVRLGKKYGLMNLTGALKLDPIYDRIEPTNLTGYYQTESNGKIGIIDTTWAVRFKPMFSSMTGFNAYGMALAKEDGGFRLIQRKTMKPSKIYESIGDFNTFGLATIRTEAKTYGLIDTNLNVVLEPSFTSIGSFNEFGLAPACRTASQCGYLNTDGREVLPMRYESVGNFNAFGLAVARGIVPNYNGLGKEVIAEIVFDREGHMVIPPPVEGDPSKTHYEVTDTIHGDHYNAVIVRVEDQEMIAYHLVDKDNLKLMTTTTYEVVGAYDVNHFFPVRKDKMWGLIDSTCKIVAPCKYAEIRKPSDNTYYAIRNGEDKWGFLNTKGRMQVPFEYTEVRNFRGGFAVVSKGKDKWGLINKFNAKIAPCAFRAINTNGTRYDLTDADNNNYAINANGDCEENCQKFEEVRKQANQAIVPTQK